MVQSGANRWFILVVLALAQFMVVLDVSVVNVALPAMQKAFSLSATNLQWIITAYTLCFGGFLLLGGRTADLFGRRRTFLAGVTVFTLASLGTGLAQSGTALVVFRGLQGLAAAFMSPSALSTVLVTFTEGRERNVALAVWGAVASAGAAVGVLVGGLLTQYLGWRWNFFVNIPVGVFILVAGMMVLSRFEGTADRRSLDLLGAASVTSGLILLVYGLIKAPDYGWHNSHTLTFFAGAAVLLLWFVVNEARERHALMPLAFFRTGNVAGADLLMLLMAATLFSSFFFASLYMQNVLHYSPVKTGVAFIPVPLSIALAATNVPRIIRRIGYKPILVLAPLVVGAGLYWTSFLPVNGSYWHNLLPGFVLLGLGMGSVFVSVTIAATTGVTARESGLASGLLTTSQQIGGSVGLAVLTSLATSSTNRYLTAGGTFDPASIAAATVHGFDVAFEVAAGLAVLASMVALVVLRPVVQAEASEPDEALQTSAAA